MDTIVKYRELIKELITKYAQFTPSRGDVEIEKIFDEANDHYELIYSGWNGIYRIHGSVFHIDIRNGKILIQQDGSEEGIAEEFVKAGVDRNNIVLGYKPPSTRALSGFAQN
jgi:hypothetical protein